MRPLWRRTEVLVGAAALLVAVDIARFYVLPPAQQTNFMNGFETLVAALAAIASASAAARSRRLGRGLWTLVAAYFVLLAIADGHDLLLGVAPGATALARVMETMGWFTYLPLALLVFFPFAEKERSPWSAISILDFAQVTLVLGTAYFRFIYLPKALDERGWTVMDHADVVRNVLIAGGLLLRAVIDPSSQARRFYFGVGTAFASMTFLLRVFDGEWVKVSEVGRPACLMALGILAALWQERPEEAESERNFAFPYWSLSVLPLIGPLLVILLAEGSPAPYDTAAWGAIVLSLALFVTRASLAERDRRAKERALRDSEARLRSFVENAPYGITRASVDGDCFLEVNPALVEMLGYGSEAQVLALKLSTELYAEPDGRARFLAQLSGEGSFRDIEVRWRKKDGNTLTVQFSGRRTLDSKKTGEIFECIVEDVTERRKLEEQLRHAQKMDAIGRLAGGVAHDFNNLLGVIVGNCDLLLGMRSEEEESRQHAVEEIRRAAEHAASLTRQLLAFSRKQVSQPTVLDLNDVVADAGRMLRRFIGEEIELVTDLEPELGSVRVDRGQFEQVLFNLAVNARDAMPAGGELELRTANTQIEGAPRVQLEVRDSGVGMSAETRARVFEPFFTTKAPGEGTGLGLATVYGIVQESGGEISVSSELGRGTTFTISLPAVDAPAEPRVRRVLQEAPRGHETILLAEDVAPLRELAHAYLGELGYSLLVADRATEALRLADEHPGVISLLITDITMPEISGTVLAESLVRKRPETRVLFISGYAEESVGRTGAGVAFLQKPFSLNALALKVRALLDSA